MFDEAINELFRVSKYYDNLSFESSSTVKEDIEDWGSLRIAKALYEGCPQIAKEIAIYIDCIDKIRGVSGVITDSQGNLKRIKY